MAHKPPTPTTEQAQARNAIARASRRFNSAKRRFKLAATELEEAQTELNEREHELAQVRAMNAKLARAPKPVPRSARTDWE